MTMSEGRDCLKYRMEGSLEEIGSWGHEYVRYVVFRNIRFKLKWSENSEITSFMMTSRCVLWCILRHLTSEAAAEWQELEESNTKGKEQLNKLIRDIVPYLMTHNAEAEACDLLMEVEKMDDLIQFVDDSVFTRVCLYLKRYSHEKQNHDSNI